MIKFTLKKAKVRLKDLPKPDLFKNKFVKYEEKNWIPPVRVGVFYIYLITNYLR